MTVIGAHPPYNFLCAQALIATAPEGPAHGFRPAYTPRAAFQVRELTEQLCADFDDAYWLKRDQEAAFRHAFYRSVADAGLLGIAMPEASGGSGLGLH